jgi:hypothetical protein
MRNVSIIHPLGLETSDFMSIDRQLQSFFPHRFKAVRPINGLPNCGTEWTVSAFCHAWAWLWRFEQEQETAFLPLIVVETLSARKPMVRSVQFILPYKLFPLYVNFLLH